MYLHYARRGLRSPPPLLGELARIFKKSAVFFLQQIILSWFSAADLPI